MEDLQQSKVDDSGREEEEYTLTTLSRPKRSPPSPRSSSSSWTALFLAKEDDVTKGGILEDSTSACDRRLSRAARFLVTDLLLDYFSSSSVSSSSSHNKRKQQEERKKDNNINPTTTVWELLEQVLDGSKATNKNVCPLWPDRDLYRNDEQKGVKLLEAHKVRNQWGAGHSRSTLSTLMINMPARGYAYNPHFYVCQFCQKMFTTRYYLDLHLDRIHLNQQQQEQHDENDHEDSRDMICPARDWCVFLPTCQETALSLEPYYDRGSEGRRESDRSRVAHKLWKQAHQQSCTHETVQAAQRACQAILDTCAILPTHEHAFREFWQTRVCQQVSSCPTRLHRWYFAAQEEGHAVLRQVHEWQEEWETWSSEEIHLSSLVWLVVGMALCYAFVFWQHNYAAGRFLRGWNRPSPHKPKTRLLSKKQRSSSWLRENKSKQQ